MSFHSYCIEQLSNNKRIFQALFNAVPAEAIHFRPAPEKWNILEITCHLFDEEKEDFRARLLNTLEDPTRAWAPINPAEWVIERAYAGKQFSTVSQLFLAERDQSVQLLHSLKNPMWKNEHVHPSLGKMSAEKILASWLAHDILHQRQLLYNLHSYLASYSEQDLSYAGRW